MSGSRARLAVAVALLAACGFVCGCGPRLEHNTSSIPEYTYACESYGGEADLDGNLKFSKIASVKNRIRVTPIVAYGDNITVKVTMLTEDEKPTVYGDKNLGVNTFSLNKNGKYTLKTGSGILKGIGDLFFEVPDKRLKKGDSWNAVRFHDEFFFLYGHKFEFQQPVEFKYTYVGNERVDGEKCAHLKVAGSHQESSTVPLPEGIMDFVTKMSRTGDIYFELGPGRVKKMTFDQVITYTAIDSETGEKAVEINNTTKKVCEIAKQ